MNSRPSDVETVDDVLRHLDGIIDRARVEQDPCGYFAALYRRITRAVRDAIGRGYFENGPRMERLDVVFARRYLDAWEACRGAGGTVTEPWRIAFDAARDPSILVLQHLLLGVNAHVDLDLGIAAAEVCSEDDLDDLKVDFFRLNDLLAQEVDGVRKELEQISFVLRWFDLFGRLQDRVIDAGVDLGRDHAWSFAERLANAPSETARRDIRRDTEGTAALARFIRWPGWLLGLLLRVVRWTERGSVRHKIDILAS